MSENNKNSKQEQQHFSTQSQMFTVKNIIQDFSFNNVDFKLAKWYNKIFCSTKFIKAFLRLTFPSLFWGLFTALVPILFNTMINGFYKDAPVGNQLYLSVNYTSYVYGYINPLVSSFIFAAFPAFGNYIAQHNKLKLQEVMRWTAYLSLVFCTIGLCLEEGFASQIALVLVWQYTLPVTGVDLVQLNYSIILIRWFAISGFFYCWLWLYVPTLSSMKNAKSLFYSSIIGFIYFIIAYTSYLATTLVNVGNVELAPTAIQNHLYQVDNGIGGIYLGYYIIQPVFLWFYIYWPKQFKVWEAYFLNIFIHLWNGINDLNKNYQLSTRKKPQRFPSNFQLLSINKDEYTDYERDLLMFQTGFKVKWSTLERLWILSWAILLDQIFYATLNIILVVYGTNFHGYWTDWNGIIVNNDPGLSLHMAKEYYKLILANVSLISTYIFTIYNGFSLLPQYFVSYYIGKGDKQTAYHNSLILTNWSIVIGLLLALIIVIYGSFINELIYSSASPSIYYYFTYHGTKIALGTYGQLWADSYYIELIYSLAVLFDTAVAMCYYILVAGGSKFVILADSACQVINVIALIALYYTNYNNFYVYYMVNRIHTLLKAVVTIVVIYCHGALWGIDSIGNKKSWFKQKIIGVQK